MKTAIYAFECTANGKRYIGASTRPNDRRRSHLRNLRKGKGINQRFQHDFDTFGEASFVWYVVAQPLTPSLDALRDLEEQVIASAKPEYNFNLVPHPINPGVKKERGVVPAPILVNVRGKPESLVALAREFGLNPRTVRQRYTQRGYTAEQALQPIKSYKSRHES